MLSEGAERPERVGPPDAGQRPQHVPAAGRKRGSPDGQRQPPETAARGPDGRAAGRAGQGADGGGGDANNNEIV